MLKCPGCGEDNPPKFRLCGYCGAPLTRPADVLPAHEVRKTVTIVFSDLRGSTTLGEHLDAEALHEVKERYFAAMAAQIVRHGGKIEKYIGDAIMAVFGLPRAHEDDALRAVRAAVDMQHALVGLNEWLELHYGVTLANRTGVNTGEVVANDDPGANQKLATGDAVNVAARLEQAAPDQGILLGETTWQLVRDAVEVQAVPPLELKGKAQRVKAYLLISAAGQDGRVRRHDRPIVGRDAELAQLRQCLEDAVARRTPRLVTVIGDAGAGKSRLVREVMEGAAASARTLSGRCLPYGDGITFWPLLMMVREAAGILEQDSPETARGRLLRCVGDPDVADRLASAAGLLATTFPLAELNWAARKFFQRLAADQPLVALLDDIHWAEPAFLALVAHVLGATHDAPVLLLATARHELLEERPDWGTQDRATRLMLHPLADADSAQVVTHLLGAAALPQDVVARIVQAAGGNPLYAEQLLSMLVDNGALRQDDQGHWVRVDAQAELDVPPTIHALLEERLDRLARPERATVDPASVIGLEFRHDALASLAPPALRESLGDHLGALTRKQFIHGAGQGGRDLVYRFHHHLVRETVYRGLLKRTRAQLHIDFVRWADRINADHDRALEFEALLGYHLEQAHHCLKALGPLDTQGHAIGADASRRLSSAGKRAFARGDLHAATNLLQRAADLLPPSDPARLDLLLELGEALMDMGRFDEARAVLDEAEQRAEAAALPRVRLGAQLVRMLVRLHSGEPGDWGQQALRIAEDAMPVLDAMQAHNELAHAWRVAGTVHGIAAHYGQIAHAVEQSIGHARQAGNLRMVARSSLALSVSSVLGPTPVPRAIALCEGLLTDGGADRMVHGTVMCTLAHLRARNGQFDVARQLYRDGRTMLRELGHGVNAASTGLEVAWVELLAGAPAVAEAEIRADYEFLREHGETYFLSTLAGLLARVVREQGRLDEAMTLSEAAEAAAASDDVESQILWRCVRAPMLVRLGRPAQGEALARAGLALARDTDAPLFKAEAYMEYAAVMRALGHPLEAQQALDEARKLFEEKGDIVSPGRLAALASAGRA